MNDIDVSSVWPVSMILLENQLELSGFIRGTRILDDERRCPKTGHSGRSGVSTLDKMSSPKERRRGSTRRLVFVVPRCVLLQATRYDVDFQDRRTWKLHQCIRPQKWSNCSGPSWVSAHIRNFASTKDLEGPSWHPVGLVAPGRPFVHLFIPSLADLGREAVNI